MTNTNTIDTNIDFYKHRIYSLLINHSEDDIRNSDNYLLSKIFEYYACIELMSKYNRIFECHDFILPDKKLELCLSSKDDGVDLCDLENSICQVKLYSNCITWKCLSTFLGQQNGYDENGNTYIKWKNMYLFRNEESHLSKNVPLHQRKIMKQELCKRSEFIDDIIEIKKEIKKEIVVKDNEKSKTLDVKSSNKSITLRKYQKECKNMLENSSNQNVVLCLPTGTGKTLICISFIKSILNSNILLEGLEDKFLILVPKCQLLDQWYNEIIRFYGKPKDICRIDHEYKYDLDRDYKIYICVYNSIDKVLEKVDVKTFKKIIIDEAHHIRKPEIYQEEEYDEEEEEYDEEEEEYDSSSSTSRKISFTETISQLRKYNNVIEVSATIDKPETEIHKCIYYKYDLRRAIDEGYISDYQIIIPIFSDYPDDSVIAKYLVNNGINHCIIFSKCKEEGKKFHKLMNETLKGCCAYIDSDTKTRDRNLILENFELGKIRFIVNIRILSEGYNSIIAESCVFLHMSSNDTFIIQAIGRILRKSDNKKIANVYLPYLNVDEGDDINRIISIMSETDTKLKEEYKKREIGGMINFNYVKREERVREEDEEEEEEVEEEGDDEVQEIDILHKYDIIFNSLGESNNRFLDIWRSKLEKVKDYININGEKPSISSKDEDIKRLGQWISTQITNYGKKQKIMKNEEIRNEWLEFISDDRYKEKFLSNEEIWRRNLEEVKDYININGEKPSISSKDVDIKRLGQWISTQITNYTKKKDIMKNEEIRNEWIEFISDDRYKKEFLSNEEIWRRNLEEVKDYIDRNGKRPSFSSKDEDIKRLGKWIEHQITNYGKKQQIMKNEEIRNEWIEFISDDRYKKEFLSNEEIWRRNLEEVKDYININGEKPSKRSKDVYIKRLGQWIQHQVTNYNKKQDIMKNEEIRNEWIEFISDDRYKKEFKNTKFT